MLCHGSSAQAEQRSSPSHSAVSIKITLATLGAQLPLQCPSPSQDDRSTDFQWIFILFFPSYFVLIIISYPYPAPIIPASVAARPRHFSAARSTAARSTAARRQERSAESGAMSWPRNRILTNQSRAPRPRDQLSTNQGRPGLDPGHCFHFSPEPSCAWLHHSASQQPFVARRNTIQYLHLNIHTHIILTVISTDYISI